MLNIIFRTRINGLAAQTCFFFYFFFFNAHVIIYYMDVCLFISHPYKYKIIIQKVNIFGVVTNTQWTLDSVYDDNYSSFIVLRSFPKSVKSIIILYYNVPGGKSSRWTNKASYQWFFTRSFKTDLVYTLYNIIVFFVDDRTTVY